MPPDTDEVWLVADDEQVYIGVTSGVTRMLGYEVAELIGQRVQDVAAPELQAATAAHWLDFLAEGRQDGVFRLRSKDGRHISLRYQARAHHPVPGFHMSRLWPDDRSSQRTGIAGDRASV